ncbi:MAG: hypothetical protein AAF125_21585, partial [Chloroflexota bacterium]
RTRASTATPTPTSTPIPADLEGDALPPPPILSYPDEVEAGEVWGVSATGLDDCEQVTFTLLSGLAAFTETVEVDAEGRAGWALPSETLTQAGDARLSLECGRQIVTSVLTIAPGPLANVDLFAVANTVTAYGQGETEVLALLTDAYGNPVHNVDRLRGRVVYPDGSENLLAFTVENGLARADFTSAGLPGRARVTLGNGLVVDATEIRQAAGPPANVILRAPDCVLADGRDLFVVEVGVRDAGDAPIADGTALRLTWESGESVAVTKGGAASVRVPAPNEIGQLTFTVPGFDAEATVQAERRCDG